MNILYVTFSFNVGGIEKLLVDVMNTIADIKENNVFLCVINNSYDKNLLKSLNSNVKVILLNRPVSGRKLEFIIKYTRIIFQNKIDIIHCQMENAVKFSIPAKILKPAVKIFTTVHDTKIYSSLKYYEVSIDKFFCNKIIAISDSVKKEILSRGVKEHKIVKIYNAVDIDKFSIKSCEAFDKRKIVIGNVARLIPRKKGQDLLIKAVSRLKSKYPKIKCLFAGGGEEQDESINRLKVLCHSLNVEENIEFLGNVDDISGFLDKIDIFVLPSRYEGFGIALIEAMVKGIPCIASNIDGPKEIINDDSLGLLFESENIDDLTEKLEYRINSMNIDRNIIRKYVIKNFDIRFMVKRLLDLYVT
ncbi:glycosyltransferase [uncultured Clostridium sp.]|uniref:glycosyltransferase n=1 Tax=uncultured Clostridium sp. TaxID=59620 RepID=UPI0025DA93DC|nr:glycosyltransferase [uncultured Clostridium sp.]